jgi:L-alanine-DL-glutamate epimerase-like enolase superfamily enzyme
MSGLTESGVGLMAASALSAAHGIRHPAALNGPQFLKESILRGGWPVKGGAVQIARGPGLGVEVDEEALERLKTE